MSELHYFFRALLKPLIIARLCTRHARAGPWDHGEDGTVLTNKLFHPFDCRGAKLHP